MLNQIKQFKEKVVRLFYILCIEVTLRKSLTTEEIKEYKDEIARQYNIPQTVYYKLKAKQDIEGLLYCSFNWGGSFKGSDYWIALKNRVKKK